MSEYSTFDHSLLRRQVPVYQSLTSVFFNHVRAGHEPSPPTYSITKVELLYPTKGEVKAEIAMVHLWERYAAVVDLGYESSLLPLPHLTL